ncbi:MULTISPECIES: hypothetical protein [Clostridium]|uniref:Uncharacterized protein n=2 Tax=Clostridium TaxID=1485 RepID=A0A151ALA3_9CLOT|nr:MULTISPECIES: hypothetical protein [Clostridium]KYH28431.1 hypothetical protein CLCOL_19230 [Clostridium colicanis DSM 13634]MBE6043448.1 hypothetical protein [Clostridium thermopalmarium]PRR75701.1 hypothetical protein CPAL_05320 [Clostridium thermopalmarium DSM 5974]PVZ26612.1 hypothetical protein LX19_00689 [Clostridium thermopalmarium DSM 5974]
MRLDIILDKNIIKNKFNIDTKYDILRNRINRHRLVVSNELKAIWDEDAEKNNYKKAYDEWFLSILREKTKVKKVNIEDLKKGDDGTLDEGEILIKTALLSEDKILIGNYYNSNIKGRYSQIKFISEEIFMKEDKQTVKLSNIEDVLVRNKYDILFDIYETPVRIEVTYGNADILAKYLSKFYKNTKSITIKDKYLNNTENERNLNKYILKYINKKDCKIKFITYWDKKTKDNLKEKFTNYEGYNSEVILSKKEMAHSSYIETDEYIIDLGYRLKVFGGSENDGETEYEIINITRK